MKRALALLVLISFSTSLTYASDVAPVLSLPAPHKTGGMPLMEALALRSSSRSFDKGELSIETLSDLLWAAYGINRPDGKRTAPSAKNFQETDIYVLLEAGAYRYVAKEHQLEPVAEGDLREFGGTQDFVKDAPVTLVFVTDYSRTGDESTATKKEWGAIAVGCISQNVYLFCASEGLVTGARATIDKKKLGSKLHLRSDQYIVLAQSVANPRL